jgi:20S proteasome alpha/beta subunit
MDPLPDYLTQITTGTCHVVVQTPTAVIMASDSRTSGGSYVASPFTNKITQIGPNIFMGRCGAASQTQYLAQRAADSLHVLRLFGSTTRFVESVSTNIAQSVQANRDILSTSLVIAGWDESGPHVFDIAPSGFVIERKIAVLGSGSVYIASWIDRNYREDFTAEEATTFAIRAISHAIVRDGACGGVVNIVTITKDGAKRRTVKPAAQPVKEEGITT